MKDPHDQREPSESEVSFAQVLHTLWYRRWMIIVVTVMFTIAGLIYAILATPYYRAVATIIPRESNVSNGWASQLSQFAGIASIAGVSLGGAARQEPLAVMQSSGFARRFVERNDLSQDLQAAVNSSLFGRPVESDEVVPIGRLVEEFKRKALSIGEDKKAGIVTVGITWNDPVVAADLANRLVDQINEEMRLRVLGESEANVQFLKAQLAQTEVVSIQESLSRLLEAEMKNVMMTRASGEYAFRVIDRAEPPIRRESPKRAFVVIASLLSGAFLSVMIALFVGPARQPLLAARAELP